MNKEIRYNYRSKLWEVWDGKLVIYTGSYEDCLYVSDERD